MTQPQDGNAFDDRDVEAPEADVLEQHTLARDEDDEERAPRTEPPLEANDADAAEQDQVAEIDDEDDYR